MSIITLNFESDQLKEQAQVLSERYHIPLANHTPLDKQALSRDSQACPQLYLTEERLELRLSTFTPLFVDFNQWELERRQKGKQPLLQACKPTPGMKILDATAGWGKDAYLLARAGANVIMLERNPIMAALLDDALRRLSDPVDLSLIYADTKKYLSALKKEELPQLIYFDPMHPERKKSALVKKNMQILQDLIGPDEDALETLKTALQHAQKKVVVKWPQKLPPLMKPQGSIPGKTIRFDLYAPNCINP